jgi:hypothetical protein
MKHVLALALVAVLAVTAGISAGQAKASGDVVASVIGGGIVRFDPGNALPFSFSARLHADGTADGTAWFDFFQFSPRLTTRLDIDCVRIAQDGVILSGVITASDDPYSVGKEAVFGVIDDDTSGDRISSVFDDLPPGADCTNTGLAVSLAVERGIVEVMP